MKYCGDCYKRKKYREFYPSKFSRDGYGSYCKPCTDLRRSHRFSAAGLRHFERLQGADTTKKVKCLKCDKSIIYLRNWRLCDSCRKTNETLELD